MRPCRATRAGTQAPPLPIPIIFFHAIPHKQNNHSRVINPNETNRPCVIHPNNINHPRAICPNETNRPCAIHPNDINRPTHNPPKRNRRGGACVPARTSAQRRFHTQMNEYSYTTHRGRKCIAHSRPHSLKQIVCMQTGIEMMPFCFKASYSFGVTVASP